MENTRANKSDVAKILRKWLPAYLNESLTSAKRKKAENALLEVYSIERKNSEVNKYYGKYLCKYLKYDTFSSEDCLQTVNDAIIQTCTSPKIKKQLIDVGIDQLSDGYIANKFEIVLNPNIGARLKSFIAEKNGTTKYTLNILRIVDESKLDLFSENTTDLEKLLSGYSDGANKNKIVNTLALIYKLRRTVRPGYSYLREFIDRERHGLSFKEKEKIQKKIIKVFREGMKSKELHEYSLNEKDFLVFNEYFLSEKNITVSGFAKEKNIKNINLVIDKLQNIFLQIAVK